MSWATSRRPAVYLASTSPRRRELLAQLGVTCEVIRCDVDESAAVGEHVSGLVKRLALAKVRAGVARRATDRLVVAADTAVTFDGEIFGKPADRTDAVHILTRLSGNTHQVYSAVAVADGRREQVAVSCSDVTFRPIEPLEIAAYWDTGEPADKAGAYAIQGLGALFVSQLAGSYSGVMGLPLFETATLLQGFGCRLLGLPPDEDRVT